MLTCVGMCVRVSSVLVLVWLHQCRVDHLTLIVPVGTQPGLFSEAQVVVLMVATNRYRNNVAP